MATVTKDFRIKSGLVVEGANATVNGSDIITEDTITGGTQTNIAVTYDAQNKVLNFVAENGIADSTTDDLAEGTSNLYFTDDRAKTSAKDLLTATNTTLTNISITQNGMGGLDITAENGVADSTTDDLDEGTTNLYYTDARARTAVSAETNGPLTYNSTSGEFDVSVGAGLDVVNGQVVAKTTTTPGIGQYAITTDVGGNLVFNLPYQGLTNPVRIDDASGEVTLNLGDGLETSGGGPFGSNLTIDRDIVDTWYDAAGSAATAEQNANNYTDSAISGLSTTLSVAGDTGTDTVNLQSDTLTFNGDANLTVAVTDNTVTVSSNATILRTPNTLVVRDGIGGIGVEWLGGNGFELTNTSWQADNLVIVDGSTTIYDNNTFVGSLNVNNGTITNLSTPVNASDAATKNYVDSIAAGLTWKSAVNLLAVSNVPLTGNTETVVIDGHAALDGTDDGYRLLLIGQTTAEENGVYVYDDNGTTYTLTRATDLDTIEELDGAAVFVMEGTQYGSTSWVQANHYAAAFADQEWDQFSGAGTYLAGYGLTLTGNTFAVDATEIASQTDLGNAVDDLTAYVDGFLNSNDGTTIQYIDAQDLATLTSANSYTDTAIEAGDATATPTYLAIELTDVAKQVASTMTVATASEVVAYNFLTAEYRSAKFLVKVAYGTHTQVSEVLLTLDSSDNIAITEYAIVGTNGATSTVSAGVNTGTVELLVTTANDNSVVTVMGTLIK